MNSSIHKDGGLNNKKAKMSEVLFKVLIIGDALVGKTSFVQKYVHGNSRREYKPTIGGKNKRILHLLQICSVFSHAVIIVLQLILP